MAGPQISLQLYTLRELTKADFAGTMKQVRDAGYDHVELAGYGNLKNAADAKRALDDAGLKVSGVHAGLPDLQQHLDRVFDDSEILGNKLIILPHLAENQRKDAAGWKQAAEKMNEIGRAVHERGMEFAYHNHSFEFQKFDGAYGYDLLFNNTRPHLVKAEIDVYWVKHGGEEPVKYIEKLSDRVIALHLKDMAAGEERRFAPVGTGILDFRTILDAAAKAGVKWGVVEQDNCYEMPPLESIRISRDNLRKLGY